jgi:hypothetical protein
MTGRRETTGPGQPSKRRARKPAPYRTKPTDRALLLAINEPTRTIRRAQAEQLEAVRAARADGIPWSWIAEALEVSRQSAHERFAGKV